MQPHQRIKLDKKFLATRTLGKRRRNWPKLILKATAFVTVVLTCCAFLTFFTTVFYAEQFGLNLGTSTFSVRDFISVTETGQIGLHTKDPQAALDINAPGGSEHRVRVEERGWRGGA